MNLEEIRNRLTDMKNIKRSQVKPLMRNLSYRPTFNIDFYRESLLHRFVELLEGAITLIEKKNFLSAVVCARAAQETFSVIAYVSFKLKELENTKDLSSLLDTMHRLSFGWRNDEKFPEMINVLTCIDHVSKKLDSRFRRQYDRLSESAHPNCSGVLGAYSIPNHESLVVDIGLTPKASDRLASLVEATIGLCVILFQQIQLEFEERMNNTLEICIELHEEGRLNDIFYKKT